MRKVLFLGVLFLIMSGLFSACKDMAGGKLLPVSGSSNELLVVMPENMWKGAMGDSIRKFFAQEMVGLPQREPIFDIISVPNASFERNLRTHRSILMVTIKEGVDSAMVAFYDSPWANTQKIFKVVVPDSESFYQVLNANKKKMMSVYLKAERDRLMETYRKNVDSKIFQFFKDQHNLLLHVPVGYNINKKTHDFAWISAETEFSSRGIVFYEEPYTDQGQFNYRAILERMNEELKEHIPASLDSSWMALDMAVPMTVTPYEYNGKHYALLLRGMWTAVNDFMAGPFVLNVVLDEEKQRVIYMMGYVYAPEDNKRNFVRQVESILYTMRLEDLKAKKSDK